MGQKGFENRELSWLAFNERVLEKAEEEQVPLCERLFFLSVFESNQDEFFMVRVGALTDLEREDPEMRENKTHRTPREQLEAIAARVRRLEKRRDRCYLELTDRLIGQGVRLVDFSRLAPGQEPILQEYFQREIRPLLSPQVVGKRQPFPFLSGGGLYAAVSLETRGGSGKLGLIACFSRFFKRLLAVDGLPGCYVLAEELILHYASSVFENYRVKGLALIRITRNADLDAEECAEEGDYRETMEKLLRRRGRRQPVRMELRGSLPSGTMSVLCRYLGIGKEEVYRCQTPRELSFFEDIRHLLQKNPALFFPRFLPQRALDGTTGRELCQRLKERDVLLSYPYESIRPFLQLLEEAASDPEVVSIKITLYRLAKDSKIVDILTQAAENGKEVLALLELGARFDEENNIEWSRRLQEAGCRVLYGLEGRKVHCKLCLITARRGGRICYLTQIGTGNYNERTAGQYTDLSYITAREAVGGEVSRIFNHLCLGEPPAGCRLLLTAPRGLQEQLLVRIEEQRAAAAAGRPAYIGMKMNALTDKRLICALMQAAKDGVQVDLLVRGSCCLVGGIAGYTQRIRVISIVGRFLEHSRLYFFGCGEEQTVYMGSADLMTRNTLRRVEVLMPVLDTACRQRLKNLFALLLSDNQNSWEQQSDGTYRRREIKEGERPLDAQAYLCRMAREGKEGRPEKKSVAYTASV
ncbi:MAG: polyphosphate kinase 1 [Lachnospiraceae bacterium]|nr:polyphosphate kinase 1 [Lachnospiraceae bacterium]